MDKCEDPKKQKDNLPVQQIAAPYPGHTLSEVLRMWSLCSQGER